MSTAATDAFAGTLAAIVIQISGPSDLRYRKQGPSISAEGIRAAYMAVGATVYGYMWDTGRCTSSTDPRWALAKTG